MLVSLQADYALRVLLDVALHEKHDVTVVTREIAERQRVPRVFLTKIVAQLANHGMLHTQRGKGGGVSLGRKADEIHVLDVVEAFEGSLMFNQCSSDQSCCSRSHGCAIRDLWLDAESSLKEFFRTRTLAQLVEYADSNPVKIETPLQVFSSASPM
jgi:Rrf2 family transcriptional regulator, iron-sulfur cluster assembly transcription factor